jgi:hypothetical protein
MTTTSAVERRMIKLTQVIREEFEEAPGLRISVEEAARFWDLDEETCAQVLARLLSAGFLAKGVDDRYRPAGDQPAGSRSIAACAPGFAESLNAQRCGAS